MDVIQSCVHGIELDSLNDIDNPVVVNAKALLCKEANFRLGMAIEAPPIARRLGLEMFKEEDLLYFGNLIEKMVTKKRDDNTKNFDETHQDFIELLASLQMGGNGRKALSMDEIIASGISFWVASFDPTTATTAFAVYYLSIDKDCQQRLYEKLRDVEETYETLKTYKYLCVVVNETLRLSPVPLTTPRVCVEDCELSGITCISKISLIIRINLF